MFRYIFLSLFFGFSLAAPLAAQTFAKELFGYVPDASTQTPAAYGSYAKGCLAGGEQLAETGSTWQSMRLSRNRNWGHPDLIAFIKRLSKRRRGKRAGTEFMSGTCLSQGAGRC